MDKITLESGKYELTFDGKSSILRCNRYGEEWVEIPTYKVDGGKMMIAWFYEMIELQQDFERLNDMLMLKEKVMKVEFGSFDPKSDWIGDFYCTKCNEHLSAKKNHSMSYCQNCGAKLDWDVSKEDMDK